MAAVWFTRAIRKIVKVSLEEKGMVVVMKKENRAGRFCVAVLLAALLTTQAVPLAGLCLGETGRDCKRRK